MDLSPDLANQVLSLPPHQRYELAQQLLDSIDDKEAAALDQAFLSELNLRRDEMMRGEQVVSDWREALSAIESSLSSEEKD